MSKEEPKREEMEQRIEEIRLKLTTNYAEIFNDFKALIENELEELKKKLTSLKERDVAEIVHRLTKEGKDPKFKSVSSIMDKIEGSKGKYTPENFATEMTDLFRLRIVCNYLSDVKEVAQKLRDSTKIKEQFIIPIGKDEDKIYKSREEEPDKVQWLRLHSFVFEHKMEKECPKIEVQIMTMLFEAWDRKDHYLFYEVERMADEKKLTKPKIKMNAMSELLYVANEFFDGIQEEVAKERERGTENEGCNIKRKFIF